MFTLSLLIPPQGFSDPDTARLIEKTLKEAGKDSEVVIYEGADHGFLNGITGEWHGYNVGQTEEKVSSAPDADAQPEFTSLSSFSPLNIAIFTCSPILYLLVSTEGSQKLKEHMGFVPTPPEVYTKSWDKLFAFFGKNLAV